MPDTLGAMLTISKLYRIIIYMLIRIIRKLRKNYLLRILNSSPFMGSASVNNEIGKGCVAQWENGIRDLSMKGFSAKARN